ncbi:MAG: hypothetical protein A3F61_00240 [Candidatus Blackburnbacteria bacterium RIFCSPHIGHO2_12_FULL_41_13b]|uniref:PIN domain-containing protein n=1 Tax=Candidatus Blackburnbacteria bacterium RIFCSPHIGHO2_12_FULL_41_13b TaxID=1797517 RepID=A0A1G1V7J5_9BACT|nr:MAG: hypothetical protein A3F61_00240 [Candidatus Blackburnbacteria bacterium RIFCSPHIGHO2_12_FULL_41_13b]
MTNSLYLDTNIFLYLSDPESQFHGKCQDLVNYCRSRNILLLTSAETIQEIVYLAKNTKSLNKGLRISKTTLSTIEELLPVDKTTIEIYLKLAKKYPSATSRDLLHLATCLENKLDTAISFDRDFKKFKEINTLTPEDFVKRQWI